MAQRAMPPMATPAQLGFPLAHRAQAEHRGILKTAPEAATVQPSPCIAFHGMQAFTPVSCAKNSLHQAVKHAPPGQAHHVTDPQLGVDVGPVLFNGTGA